MVGLLGDTPQVGLHGTVGDNTPWVAQLLEGRVPMGRALGQSSQQGHQGEEALQEQHRREGLQERHKHQEVHNQDEALGYHRSQVEEGQHRQQGQDAELSHMARLPDRAKQGRIISWCTLQHVWDMSFTLH